VLFAIVRVHHYSIAQAKISELSSVSEVLIPGDAILVDGNEPLDDMRFIEECSDQTCVEEIMSSCMHGACISS
jgi:hypothetical protein